MPSPEEAHDAPIDHTLLIPKSGRRGHENLVEERVLRPRGVTRATDATVALYDDEGNLIDPNLLPLRPTHRMREDGMGIVVSDESA